MRNSFLILFLPGIITLCNAINPVNPVNFTKVHFSDQFWAPRIETNRVTSISSAFRESEKSGRFDNFALAGKLIQGEHQGDFSFDDTDPYKIIEGASYSLAVKYNPVLDNYLDSIIYLIAAAQEPDGYLTTCVTNRCTRLSGWWGNARWEKINSHELYNSGHLIEASVAHFQATGKKTLLNVAIKNADLICEVFGPGENQIHRPSGHPIVEMALMKLYKITGNKRYINLARYFIDETGRGTDGHRLSEYSQDHMPVLQQKEIKGHAVRAGYLFSGATDVAAIQQDTMLLDALKSIWNNLVSKKLYITGGIGSRAQGEGFSPNYELHNHTAYCETCAAIANVYWNQRMFLATGESKYVDVYERALYNGVIAGVSLSGDKFFYDNPLESMGQHQRQAWFGCACCPGNITRFMASVPGYMYAQQNDEIFILLYGQSESEILIENNRVKINQITNYPVGEKIKFIIHPEKTGNFTLSFRQPGWTSKNPVPSDLYSFIDKNNYHIILTINGLKSKAIYRNGFLKISRIWKSGDEVEIRIPMPVRKIIAIDSVSDDRGKIALQRGPLVYCLEGIDQSDKDVFNQYISPDSKINAIYSADYFKGTVILKGTAREIYQPENAVKNERKVPFIAIPYACWNNRGQGQMAVWIPCNNKTARIIPESDIASRANCVNGFGVNDQWNPLSSSDTSKPYHYWWLKKGTEVYLEYAFEKEVNISSSSVYWLDFDHYDGNFRVPESWKLYYKARDEWKEVEQPSAYTVLKNQYNKVSFNPITTSGLKIVAKLQNGVSGGIIEWKVN